MLLLSFSDVMFDTLTPFSQIIHFSCLVVVTKVSLLFWGDFGEMTL